MIDIVIIGAGPAGMSAALYALRAGSSVMILESENFGGQISYTPKVENYPGISTISGAQLASDLFDQIQRQGVQFDLCKADKIQKAGKNFVVTGDGKSFECKSVILAGGVKPRRLGLPREDDFCGEGVCYCALCDGAFYKGLPVAVYGGGNTALTDALFLSALCPKVYLIHRGDSFSAEKPLVDAVLGKDNIEIIMMTTVEGLLGENSLSGLQLYSASGVNAADIASDTDADKRVLALDAIFVATGRVPDNSAFADIVQLDQKGFIVADESCRTSKTGIFVAGDCRTKTIRQVATAVSDGAIAGTAAAEYARLIK